MSSNTSSKTTDYLCPFLLLIACALSTYTHYTKTQWLAQLTQWSQNRTTQLLSHGHLPWSLDHQKLNLLDSTPNLEEARDHARHSIAQSVLRITAEHPQSSGHCLLSRQEHNRSFQLSCSSPKLKQAISILPVMLLKDSVHFSGFKSAEMVFMPTGVTVRTIQFF